MEPNHVHEPGMPFDFNYAVQDQENNNEHLHNAKSDGDVTKGEYSVLLPDGRRQIVRYVADWKKGYMADVILILFKLHFNKLKGALRDILDFQSLKDL